MARHLRIDIPGLTYHVTNRGVKRLALFHDDEDRQLFIRLLLVVREQLPFTVQGFSLLTNHFHLLIKTRGTSLSQIMQILTSRYAYQFNRKYGHVGHTVQSRFHSIPVQTDTYLAEVSAYIDLNAPRAGLARTPEEYAWCGYASVIGRREQSVVDASQLLSLFSDNRDRARTLYQAFVLERLAKPEKLSHEDLLRKKSWGAIPIRPEALA